MDTVGLTARYLAGVGGSLGAPVDTTLSSFGEVLDATICPLAGAYLSMMWATVSVVVVFGSVVAFL